jgi:hypothetical protein
MLDALLFAVACQCGAATPGLSLGAVAQTTEAVFVQPKRGSPVMRVDKATEAQTAVTPPIGRTVSAIDVAADTLYVGTRATAISNGFFPTDDGFDKNFIAFFDAAGVQTMIVDHRGSIGSIAHDATHLYWTEGNAVWRLAREEGAVERFAVLDGTASTPSLRLPMQRVSKEGSVRDVPAFAWGPWVFYDEYVRFDPHVSAKARYALNVCDSASPVQIYGAGYRTTPPIDPIPESPPIAIDSCGIFVGVERKICFAPQLLAIDKLEVYLGGLALSPTLRSGGGDLVVILGHGFDAATTVDIDGQAAPVLFWTDTALSVASPKVAPGKGPVSVLLRVRNGGGCTAELITIADPRHRAAGH